MLVGVEFVTASLGLLIVQNHCAIDHLFKKYVEVVPYGRRKDIYEFKQGPIIDLNQSKKTTKEKDKRTKIRWVGLKE